MCENCIEIEAKIERCRNIQRSINDQATVKGVGKLIADLEASKAALHPKTPQPEPPHNEEARRRIEEYAGDLREIIKKFRRRPN